MINSKLIGMLLAFLNFLSLSFPYPCLPGASDQISTDAPSRTISIAVSEFDQLGDGKHSSLARVLESFVLTELLKEDWIYVEFLRGAKGINWSFLREQGFEFVVSGIVLSSEGRNEAILQLLRVVDGEIISFTQNIGSQNFLPNFERLINKVLSELRGRLPERKLIEPHIITISIPFESEAVDPGKSFLVPLQMRKTLERREIQHVNFQLFDEEKKDSKIEQFPTARLKGVLSRKNSKIHVDLTLSDKFGFTVTQKVISDEGSEFTMVEELANWASEIIKGMIKPNGQWRDSIPSLEHPDTLFRKAVNLFDNGQFDSALFYLRLAISKNPNNLRYRKVLVSTYLGKSEYKRALLELQTISPQFQDFGDAEDDKIEFFFQKGSAYLGLHEYREAADNFQIALKWVSDQELIYKIHIRLAEAYGKMKETESAITYFLNAMEIKSSDPEVYIGLARLFISQDSLALANLYLRTGINATPKEQSSIIINEFINLAKLYLLQAGFDEALKIVTQVIKKEPTNLRAHVLSGEIYLLMIEYDNAINSLKIALDLEKNDEAIFRLLSQAYLDKKEYDQALQTLEEGIKNNPKIPQLYALKAELFMIMSKDEKEEMRSNDLRNKAMQAAKEGLNVDPQCGLCFSYLAQIYFDMGEWDMAKNIAKKAIEFNPALLSPYKTFFYSLQKLGQDKKTWKHILEEMEIRYENNPKIQQVVLSLYHDELFDFEKAYKVSRRLNKNWPGSLEYKVSLVEAAISSGNIIDAEKQVPFLRGSKDVDYTLRYVGLVLSIITLLLNENWEEVNLAVNELVDFDKGLSKYFDPKWSFKGLLYFFHNIINVTQHSAELVIIEDLLRIIEEPKSNKKSERFNAWHQKVKEILRDRISIRPQFSLKINRYVYH